MIINRVTELGLPNLTKNIFTGTFNAPTPGVYDFDVAGNADQLVLDMQPEYNYLIDKVNISGTLSGANYLESLDTSNLMDFTFRFGITPYKLLPIPIPAAAYTDGLDWSYWFWSPEEGNSLLISLSGILNQIAATVGVASIRLIVQFVIQIEQNKDVVEKIRKSSGSAVGCFYS